MTWEHDRNILDWSKISFQFGLGLKTVFSFSELFWTFRRTWQYSDVSCHFVGPKQFWTMTKDFLAHFQIHNLTLGSK